MGQERGRGGPGSWDQEFTASENGPEALAGGADCVGGRGSGSWTCFVIFLFEPGGQLSWFPGQH